MKFLHIVCAGAQEFGWTHTEGKLMHRGIDVVELLRILNRSGMRLVSNDLGDRAPLAGVSLYDPLTEITGSRGGVLLGIGLHPGRPEAADVLREAAGCGFAAVVVKALRHDVAALAAVADGSEIALLVVDDDIGWRHLDALISSALTTAADPAESLSTVAVGDLFALANAIAATVGGATAIEDLQERVLAYSTLPAQPIDEDRREGILGRQVPDLPENAEQYASVFRQPGAVHVPAAAGERLTFDRLAIAVRAGTQPLGSIWVVDVDGTLDADADQALERSADIAALHMLRARSAADLDRQRRSELLRRLLAGGEDSHLVAGKLGLNEAAGFITLAFQPEFAPGPDELDVARLFDLVVMAADAQPHDSDCVVIGDTVYLLFSGRIGFDPRELEPFAWRIVDRAGAALRMSIRVAVGSAAGSIASIHRSRHDADLVLLLLATDAGRAGAVANAHEVSSRLTLLELARLFRETPRYSSPALQRMVDSDVRNGTQYARTLRVYLDCLRDSAAAAAALVVHQNTLRYRLRRAQELFGIDLADPDDTLTLWLSLRVIEFG